MRFSVVAARAIIRFLPYCIITIAVLPQPCLASNWLPLSEDKSTAVKIDMESVRSRGNYVQAWLLYEYPVVQKVSSHNPKTYRSAKSLEIYDCATKQSATLQTVRYSDPNGQGDVADSFAVNYEPGVSLLDVIPDTIGASILVRVCTIYRQSTRTVRALANKQARAIGCVAEPVFVAGEMYRCAMPSGASSYFNVPGAGEDASK